MRTAEKLLRTLVRETVRDMKASGIMQHIKVIHPKIKAHFVSSVEKWYDIASREGGPTWRAYSQLTPLINSDVDDDAFIAGVIDVVTPAYLEGNPSALQFEKITKFLEDLSLLGPDVGWS